MRHPLLLVLLAATLLCSACAGKIELKPVQGPGCYDYRDRLYPSVRTAGECKFELGVWK